MISQFDSIRGENVFLSTKNRGTGGNFLKRRRYFCSFNKHLQRLKVMIIWFSLAAVISPYEAGGIFAAFWKKIRAANL